MSSQGPNSPASAVSTDRGASNPAWGNPTFVFSSNDNRATINTSAAVPSDYLDITDFSFSIPSGATINGVTVSIERNCSAANRECKDETVQLIKGGTAQGDNKANAATWPTSDGTQSYGSTSDLWGLSLSDSDVNASNFGVRVATQQVDANWISQVDHVTITIEYTAAGDPSQPNMVSQMAAQANW